MINSLLCKRVLSCVFKQNSLDSFINLIFYIYFQDPLIKEREKEKKTTWISVENRLASTGEESAPLRFDQLAPSMHNSSRPDELFRKWKLTRRGEGEIRGKIKTGKSKD